jgi:hypothetical protein
MSIVYLGKATPASGQGGGGSITVDQTYDATSTNAQSGTAVAEALETITAFTGATSSVAGSTGLVPAPTTADVDNYLKGDGTWAAVSGLQNVATQSTSLSIAEVITGVGSVNFGTMYNPSSSNKYDSTVSIGRGTYTGGTGDVVIGNSARAFDSYSTAIGFSAYARQIYSIQLGYGENNEAKSFYVGFFDTDSRFRNNYKLLDGFSGKIPNDRINGVSGSFTSQDGKTVTVTNGVITSIASPVNLTFTVPDEKAVDSLIVNDTTYDASDFNNGALTRQFLSGTNINWTITTTDGVVANPSLGAFILTSDTTVEINFMYL